MRTLMTILLSAVGLPAATLAAEPLRNLEESLFGAARALCAPKNARSTFSTQGCGSPFSLATEREASNGRALRFQGSAAGAAADVRMRRHRIQIPIQNLDPASLYSLSLRYRVLNRDCYLEETLDPSTNWAGARPQAYKGLYCGRLKIHFVTAHGVRQLVRQLPMDYEYVLNRETPWIEESSGRFQLPTERTQLDLMVELDGFQGDLLVDDVTLTPSPIPEARELGLASGALSAFGGMRIASVGIERGIAKIETTTHRVLLKPGTGTQPDVISFELKASSRFPSQLGRIELPSGSLKNLRGPLASSAILNGQAPFWNEQLAFTVFADSSFVLRAKRPLEAKLVGDSSLVQRPEDSLSSIDLGVAFQADSARPGGFLISPVWPKEALTNASTYFRRGEDDGLFQYSLSDFLKRVGESRVRILSGPRSNAPLSAVYRLDGSIDRLFGSLFPTKQGDPGSICKQRIASNTLFLNKGDWTPSSLEQDLLALKSPEYGIRYAFINSMKYAVSNNRPYSLVKELWSRSDPSGRSIVESRFVGGHDAQSASLLPRCQETVAGETPKRCREPIANPLDPSGPWRVTEETLPRIRAYISALASGTTPKPGSPSLKAVLYVSPQFYHREDLSFLIEEIRVLLERTGAGGVYLDGLPDASPIESIQFMRGLRAKLGSTKLIVLHFSSNNQFLPDSYHTMIPAIEAWADVVARGEGSKHSFGLKELVDARGRSRPLTECPAGWGLMAAGRGSSGTSTYLFPEMRAADFRLSAEDNRRSIAIPPARQVEAQLLCGGLIWAPARASFSFIEKFHDSSWYSLFPGGDPETDGEPYWKRVQAACGD